MITGIYQSAAGLGALSRLQESIANNLANVSTDGFKREIISIQQAIASNLEAAPKLDLASGGLQMTSQSTHLALASEGFFEVAAPGGALYTRNGNFHVNAEGGLVTAEGYPVQGQKGDIVLSSERFTITPAGDILENGILVDQVKVVHADGPMERVGSGFLRWASPEGVRTVEPGQVRMLQGALEASNVNIVENMVDMMAAVRLYEANQKAMEAQDETLKQATSQVGRTA